MIQGTRVLTMVLNRWKKEAGEGERMRCEDGSRGRQRAEGNNCSAAATSRGRPAADRARDRRHRFSCGVSKGTSPAYTLISAWKIHFRFLTS